MTKFLTPAFLLATGLVANCYAYSVTDGLQVTGGASPTSVDPGQVLIRGGFIWSGANQLNFYPPTANTPVEIVNRQSGGGIDLYVTGSQPGLLVRLTKPMFNSGTKAAGLGEGQFTLVSPSANSYADALLSDEKGNAYVGFIKRGTTAAGNIGLPAGASELVSYKAPLGIHTHGGAYPISFGNNGVETMRLEPTGSLGVGTPSPLLGDGAKVTVQSNSTVARQLILRNTTTTNNELYLGWDHDGDYGAVQAFRQTAGAKNLILQKEGGNVGIGVTNPTNKLSVGGTISAMEIKVTTTGADYVFADGYALRPLSEVEAFVRAKRHLPEIPPATQMQAEGMGVSETLTKQLAKIEELTLYAIEAERGRNRLSQENQQLRNELDSLKAASAEMEKRLRLLENHLTPKLVREHQSVNR